MRLSVDDLVSHLSELEAVAQSILRFENVEQVVCDGEMTAGTIAELLAYHLERSVLEVSEEIFSCDGLTNERKDFLQMQIGDVDALSHSLAELAAYIHNDLQERSRFFSMAEIVHRYLTETEKTVLEIA